MIWILLVLAIIGVIFIANKSSKKGYDIPNELVEKMKSIMFSSSSTDEDISYVANRLFELSLHNSDKNIKLDDIIDINNLHQKPYLIQYLGLLKSLRETIFKASQLNNIKVENKSVTAENTLRELSSSIIKSINQIRH